VEILESGGKISQETRLFDESSKVTISMRGKEDAPDYRYFPEPDLVELDTGSAFMEAIQRDMPELPDHRVERFISAYGISQTEAFILTKDRQIAEYFENCVPHCKSCRRLSTWIAKDLFRLLNDKSLPIEQCAISPSDFGRLMDLIEEEEITDAIARVVLEEMFETGRSPEAIIEEKDLKPLQEQDVIESLIDQVMGDNPGTVAKIREGNSEPLNFLIGQVMRKTNGRANPKKVREILQEKLPMIGT
jgi:aspartyl-tRNA(Asn)/glutamyl-tRNA(Gln) amidotransferase subunit B